MILAFVAIPHNETSPLNARRTLLRKQCEQHSGTESALQPKRTDRVHDFYFVMADIKVAWCPVPQVARTSWAYNFLKLRVSLRI